jgi:SAM-dependent methyltransferase
VTILDVGAGKGGTSGPLIDKIEQLVETGETKKSRDRSKETLRRIKVVSLDICRHALEYTKRVLSEHIPEENITGIVANFGQVANNKELRKYLGKVDIIISGGSIMHNTDKQPFFNFMYQLLKSGGVMQIWDWSGGYSWAAPILRIAKDGKRKFVYESTKGNPLLIEEGESLSFSQQQLLSEVEYNVIFEILERDQIAIEENLIDTWLGAKRKLIKGTDKVKIESGFLYTGVDYPAHSLGFKRSFEKAIRSERGFNFLDFLGRVVSKLTPPLPGQQTPYFFIEGYGPAKFYKDYMVKAGFKNAEYEYFTDVNDKLDRRGKSADSIAAAHTLFFARGTK